MVAVYEQVKTAYEDIEDALKNRLAKIGFAQRLLKEIRRTTSVTEFDEILWGMENLTAYSRDKIVLKFKDGQKSVSKHKEYITVLLRQGFSYMPFKHNVL